MKTIATLTDEEFAELVRTAAALPDAPPALVRSAINLFRDAQPSPLMAAADGLLQRIRAVLTFDSWATGPAALGLRSMPAQSESRHMLFSAQGRDIDLRIVSAADSYVLAGQILGPDDTGMFELAVDTHSDAPARSARTVAIDDLGGFQMKDVRAGRYWMTLRLGNDAVELPAIEVGGRGN
jgi:hypothetical protein